MLKINGRKFAKNDREFTDSLFDNDGSTAVGFYKKYQNGVLLMDHQKQAFAHIVNNPYNEQFFVGAQKEDRGYWFTYGMSTKAENLLGLPDSLELQHEIAKNAVADAGLKMERVKW